MTQPVRLDPMKAIILAGGFGSRLSEETAVRPKPMVEIGGMPILWHIMKHLGTHGIEDFVICLGYKGDYIKQWFSNYFLMTSDVTFDMANGKMEVHRSRTEPWRVTLLDTGDGTLTGGRLKRALEHIDGDETVLMTYGDGVADVDVTALRAHHAEQGTLATVTAVQPPGRWGALDVHGQRVTHFREKPKGDGTWTNGGFFLLEPKVKDYIAGDATTWEEEPLRTLAHEGQLSSYKHEGHWQVMDTLKDKHDLQERWETGDRPWVTWE
jgi:glucose-1-phosphate cytidylyltransferase